MRKFGAILVQEGFATEEQIQTALAYQSLSENLLGRILMDMRFLTVEQKFSVLEHQQSHPTVKFGACAVELGFITDAQLQKATAFQTKSKGLLGELMVELGTITEAQREAALKLQFSEMSDPTKS